MRRQNTIDCCYGCTERHTACHDTCETYKRKKAEWEETKAKIKESECDEFYLHKLESIKMSRRYELLKRKGYR